MTDDALQIVRNEARGRYEVLDEGRVAAVAMFREEPGRVVFTHTVVKPEYEGRGIGSRLARHVLDDAVARGEEIVPECPFIAAYLERHPEYADSVVRADA
ncbi:GNAT family N-acetyltransferase [Agromyces sp. CFH 90414]|uniref:GNAT family N-acetyltransferase n=2 Tax=Agromyces agglutinans TaxID=2662258 RepID=A0A6I2F505_9MICO|nr:GNAT family N-acetyltransferase [Agromyces agglutinans]MRG59669.1 GNAT family N-acetyltransferase [Agromyces agglutinans]